MKGESGGEAGDQDADHRVPAGSSGGGVGGRKCSGHGKEVEGIASCGTDTEVKDRGVVDSWRPQQGWRAADGAGDGVWQRGLRRRSRRWGLRRIVRRKEDAACGGGDSVRRRGLRKTVRRKEICGCGWVPQVRHAFNEGRVATKQNAEEGREEKKDGSGVVRRTSGRRAHQKSPLGRRIVSSPLCFPRHADPLRLRASAGRRHGPPRAAASPAHEPLPCGRPGIFGALPSPKSSPRQSPARPTFIYFTLVLHLSFSPITPISNPSALPATITSKLIPNHSSPRKKSSQALCKNGGGTEEAWRRSQHDNQDSRLPAIQWRSNPTDPCRAHRAWPPFHVAPSKHAEQATAKAQACLVRCHCPLAATSFGLFPLATLQGYLEPALLTA
uniref:Uncharacterized protein n=1 Tax=Setaria viridis TaxID=4556 RepID=A0A4U6TDE3_SETVI|nr:hypothetical protein SEVIR_8G088800v2 [Setaria viridis]